MSFDTVRLDLAWPLALTLVVLLPLLVGGAVRLRQRRRRARLARFATAPALARLGAQGEAGTGRLVRLALVALLGAIGLAGPRWGARTSQQEERGLDIVVALDASLSMLARDERPSRLERMKQEVRRLRAGARADRLAILAFAGRSYILTPLTADEGAIELYLENLSPETVGQAGTSLARTIRQGIELLGEPRGEADRALVVMSDGEAFEDPADVRAAAAAAAERGIALVTVGFGTPEGGTIPESFGGGVREKRDEQGEVVVTRYVPDLLATAAEAAGGTFVPAEVTDRAGRVRAALSTLRTERRMVSAREDYVARFAWFIAPAFLLLLLDTWSGRTARRPARRTATADTASVGASTAALAGAVVLLVGGCTSPPDPAARLAAGDVAGALRAYATAVAAGDTTARTRYNYATTLLAADSLDAALELFEQVRRASDGEVRDRARFNAGLGELLRARRASGDTADRAFAAARALYRAYLGTVPADIDGKWNYELALRPQPPMGGGGGGGGDNDDPSDPTQDQADSGGGALDRAQAEALLSSAARDERDVQGRRQRMTRQPPPPGGKDW
ncbi:MAG TPA: VWA domain-containing protein [Gemmatimonadaceae bacterium]|nr:VWA domain-containing protein [Gemmatimonadaceae bacterium]